MQKYHFDGNKLIYHMERVYDHFRDGKRIVPLHIDLGATKLCNAKCTFCYGAFQKMTGEIMPKNVLMDIFGTAKALGIKSITITGDGEPTLNPHIYEAIKLGKSTGLDIGFSTNGIALNKEKIQTILDSCTWLRFTLGAVSKKSYKKIHGVDLWDKVKKNIELTAKLKENSKCTVGLQMVLIPLSIKEIIPEASFATSLGLDYFVIKQFSDPGSSGLTKFPLDWYDTKDVLTELELAENLSIVTTKIIVKKQALSRKGYKNFDHCVDCALLLQISGSSKCYPCGYLFGNEKYCYGDLKKITLKELIASERYWQIIKEMREKFDVYTDCKGECRHSFTNEFIWDYLHSPEHINFI